MQEDFHYYATYCAAYIAGYSHEDSLAIAYSAQFVDHCSATLLKKVHAPRAAATTQLQSELMEARTDIIGLQDITRIWASFHFLPYDLYAPVKAWSRTYRNKYRLICRPNGDLIVRTVDLAKDKDLESIGLAMHVMADTWAHAYFAGTPSQVINNTDFEFYEVVEDESGKMSDQRVSFRHNPAAKDDIEKHAYTNSINDGSEHSIMNLGHGRAGHLPDYSFIHYKYLPAWGKYDVVDKDNPSDYLHAFCQMIYAMKYLRGYDSASVFEKETYDYDAIAKWKDHIDAILRKRQLDASKEWKAFGEDISGQEIPPFDIHAYQKEYLSAGEESKDQTPLGRFIIAAMRQKSMVTNAIFESGNMLAGISIDYWQNGFKGIKDYKKLTKFLENSRK